MNQRNAPCLCGLPQKMKHCDCSFTPSSLGAGASGRLPSISTKTQRLLEEEGVIIKTPAQIEKIRAAGHLAAKILDQLCEAAQEGVMLEELNHLALKLHEQAGATPAPLGYGDPPFPKAICTSLNDVICHGIPGPRRLRKGDTMNIDVTVILDGFYGDCSKMVCIGEVSQEDRLLVETCYEALMASIEQVAPGKSLHLIGETITKVAEKRGYGVVRDFVGHGVGLHFHEGPNVLHCENELFLPLQPGMTFTIEPMLNLGRIEHKIEPDGWTATTIDARTSAQWEHTLLVTSSGVEILTPWTPPSKL